MRSQVEVGNVCLQSTFGGFCTSLSWIDHSSSIMADFDNKNVKDLEIGIVGGGSMGQVSPCAKETLV